MPEILIIYLVFANLDGGQRDIKPNPPPTTSHPRGMFFLEYSYTKVTMYLELPDYKNLQKDFLSQKNLDPRMKIQTNGLNLRHAPSSRGWLYRLIDPRSPVTRCDQVDGRCPSLLLLVPPPGWLYIVDGCTHVYTCCLWWEHFIKRKKGRQTEWLRGEREREREMEKETLETDRNACT